jgi:prolyl 4-hydroxylase
MQSRFPELNDPGLVFLAPGAYSPSECALLVKRIEEERPRLTTDGTPRGTVRHNSRVVLFDRALADDLFRRISSQIPSTLIGMNAVGANECIRFYRYGPGDFFKPHQDTDFMRSPQEKSLLSIVVYLNDEFEGGELMFPVRGDAIKPAPGLAVLFGHRILHESAAIRSGTKYAFRSDVMYRRTDP